MVAGYRIGIVISIHIKILRNIYYREHGVIAVLPGQARPQAVIRMCVTSFRDPAVISWRLPRYARNDGVLLIKQRNLLLFRHCEERSDAAMTKCSEIH
jgi:hypothetical protein